MGHSFGGTFAQLLVGNGLGSARYHRWRGRDGNQGAAVPRASTFPTENPVNAAGSRPAPEQFHCAFTARVRRIVPVAFDRTQHPRRCTDPGRQGGLANVTTRRHRHRARRRGRRPASPVPPPAPAVGDLPGGHRGRAARGAHGARRVVRRRSRPPRLAPVGGRGRPAPVVAAEVEEAGRRALRRGAVATAAVAFERAAGLERDVARRGRLLVDAAAAASDLGRSETVMRLLAEALLGLGPHERAQCMLLEDGFRAGPAGDPAWVLDLVQTASRMAALGDPDLALNLLVAAAARCYWGNLRAEGRAVILAADAIARDLDDHRMLYIQAFAAPMNAARSCCVDPAPDASGRRGALPPGHGGMSRPGDTTGRYRCWPRPYGGCASKGAWTCSCRCCRSRPGRRSRWATSP